MAKSGSKRQSPGERYSSHLPVEFGMKEGAEQFPLMVLAQVSNVCNSGCVHCWFNANPRLRKRFGRKYMATELLRKIIDEIAERADPRPLLRITGTGEPFLMPELTETLVYACARKKARVGVITNGSLLTPERSTRLIDAGMEALEISADAGDRESYERIRRGLRFETLIDNIEHMVAYRNKTKAGTRILVSIVENTKEIEPAAARAFWLPRVDNVIMRKYLTYGQLSEEGYARETYLPPDERVPCPYPFERMPIMSDGVVTFCNFDVENGYAMGNVCNQTIAEIWRGAPYEAWRRLALAGRFEEVPLCDKCSDWKYKSWTHNFFKVLEHATKDQRET